MYFTELREELSCVVTVPGSHSLFQKPRAAASTGASRPDVPEQTKQN